MMPINSLDGHHSIFVPRMFCTRCVQSHTCTQNISSWMHLYSRSINPKNTHPRLAQCLFCAGPWPPHFIPASFLANDHQTAIMRTQSYFVIGNVAGCQFEGAKFACCKIAWYKVCMVDIPFLVILSPQWFILSPSLWHERTNERTSQRANERTNQPTNQPTNGK